LVHLVCLVGVEPLCPAIISFTNETRKTKQTK
jgi:hypothetical protein